MWTVTTTECLTNGKNVSGLDPNDPTDAAKDCNGDGYTNIEKYINGIDPSRKIDWTDLRNNHDTLKERLQK